MFLVYSHCPMPLRVRCTNAFSFGVAPRSSVWATNSARGMTWHTSNELWMRHKRIARLRSRFEALRQYDKALQFAISYKLRTKRSAHSKNKDFVFQFLYCISFFWLLFATMEPRNTSLLEDDEKASNAIADAPNAIVSTRAINKCTFHSSHEIIAFFILLLYLFFSC